MSRNFERWTELAALAANEQDVKRLAELAREMNRVLEGKIHVDSVHEASNQLSDSA